MNLVYVKKNFIIGFKSEIKGLIWLHITEDGIYRLESSFPLSLLLYVANKYNVKLTYNCKKRALKAFYKVNTFFSENKKLTEIYGYTQDVNKVDSKSCLFANIYRKEYKKPSSSYCSNESYSFHYFKFKQEYLALKNFHPQKFNFLINFISRMKFEKKLKYIDQKNEYVNEYNKIYSFLIWKSFSFKIIVAEDINGEPVLFLFE